MRVRRFACFSAAILLVLLVVPLPPGDRVWAQSPTPASDWVLPRLADGHPDLQGVWVSNSATPLQRPTALSGRDRLTDDEVAELQARADRIFDGGRSAYAAGDAAYGAALNDVDTFDSPTSTSSSLGMIERVFDDRTSLVVDPPDGRIPPLTDDGRRRQAMADTGWEQKTGPEDFSGIHRCVTTGVPRLGGNFGAGPYSYYQIVQTADVVVLVMEAFHDARIIPLDDRPHVPSRVRLWNGDSRGRWEGDTLIVETQNFSRNSFFRGAAENLQLVERFTRTAEDVVTYRMTFSDATTWTAPWTAEMPLRRVDQPIYEFACHEGNHSLTGMLTTRRHEEARVPGP